VEVLKMSEKVTNLIEEIKGLTVLELSELVKALEEEFGVSAAAPVAVAAAPAGAGGAGESAPAEEKTEFDVILKDVGAEKIKVIKVVREVTTLGLKEAKELVDKAPSTVKEGIAKDEAESIIAKFKEVGATCEMK
jgi:large subunit ribosomal protein L7/L12